jgi:hypothetical protein
MAEDARIRRASLPKAPPKPRKSSLAERRAWIAEQTRIQLAKLDREWEARHPEEKTPK